MGDSEIKIEYNPEELKEIDRILKTIPDQPIAMSTVVAASGRAVVPSKAAADKQVEEEEDEEPIEIEDEEALELEAASESDETFGEEEEFPGIEEAEEAGDIDETLDIGDLTEIEETAEREDEEIQDISDLVLEVEPEEEETLDADPGDLPSEEPPVEPGAVSEELMDDITALEPSEISEEEMPSAEETADFDISSLEEPSSIEDAGPTDTADFSPLDELEAIAAEEPGAAESGMPSDEDFPGVEGLEEIGEIESAGPADMDSGISDDVLMDLEMPSIEEAGAVESPDSDVSDISAQGLEGDELPDLDISGDIGRITGIEDIPSEMPSLEAVPDLMEGMEDIPDADAAPASKVKKEKEAKAEKAPRGKEAETIDLSEKELSKVKKALVLFNSGLRKEITRIILNDLLPVKEARALVDMLISGKKEEDVLKFVEQKTGKRVRLADEFISAGRRVVTSRPEYTVEGRERQKRLLHATKVFSIVAAGAFVVTILTYQFIYKPIMAKRLIDQGVAAIRKAGEPATQKMRDYKIAEDLFREVDENYAEDYLYGYNAFARAYFDKKEPGFSLDKLNRAYKIDKSDIETLNNLGYFYSRVPQNFYGRIRQRVPGYYYKDVKPGPDKTQLEVAIDFYKRALNIEPENITSLYGIGNAYYFQGQFNNAKKYYEKIIETDEDSVVGYSGLMNLYIERDDLPNVLTIHQKLKYREMVPEAPAALLGKLAAYYLGKKRTDDINIRVDYGIQSAMIKDISDDPFPVVKSVLDSLKEKDLDYPPLYLHYARYYKATKNLGLMERSLQTALEKEPNYFGALQLLGEYYYITKEPEKAYNCFNRAISAYNSPPAFAQDDFYFETEKRGDTYLMLGDIFYYFFDKVKYRFGDELEETELDEDTEKLANYEIAREKYEKSLGDGSKAPELYYNLGRIYYIKGQYEKAAASWRNLYEDFTKNPELMYSLGNAFYYMNNFESAKGEFLKLISVFENKADDIKTIQLEKSDHLMIFETLAAAYNNLGAIYQIQNNETKSNICYWKAIDYAKRIERENEFARVNLARAFRPGGREKALPLIDRNIPYSINIYSEEMR